MLTWARREKERERGVVILIMAGVAGIGVAEEHQHCQLYGNIETVMARLGMGEEDLIMAG